MMQSILSPVLIVFVFLCSTTPNLSFAGQISIGDFSTMPQVQDFDVLGSGTISHAAPLLIGVDSFDSNNGLLKSSSKFGPAIGTNGTA